MSELMNTTGTAPVRTLDTVAAEIRTFTAAALTNIIEIGRRFREAKEMVPYGQFGDWIKENTGYSVSTANNFMKLFDEYGDKQGSLFEASLDSQTFGNLTYSKALALLAISDKDEREEFVESHDVEGMSTRELQQAIKERDEAVAEAKRIKAALDASEKRDKAHMDASQEQMDELRAKIEELESRPVEVATEKVVDQEAIDAAVKAAQEEAQKKIDAAEKAKKTAEKKLAKAEQAAKAAEAKATDAGKGASEELEKARAEAKTAQEEAETLRKQLAMSDAAVTTFKVHFASWQGAYNSMMDALAQADEETVGKLKAAIKAQLEQWEVAE